MTKGRPGGLDLAVGGAAAKGFDQDQTRRSYPCRRSSFLLGADPALVYHPQGGRRHAADAAPTSAETATRARAELSGEPMSIVLTCPSCKQSHTYPDRHAGLDTLCPLCGARFGVPPMATVVAASPSPTTAPPVSAPAGEQAVVRFACPTCKTVLGVALGLAGQKVRCANCQQKIIVPTPPPAADNKTTLGQLIDAAAPAIAINSPLAPPPPLPPPRQWYYSRDGQRFGPLPEAEVQHTIGRGASAARSCLATRFAGLGTRVQAF